ncbi:GRF1-interacting factor 3 [Orobanche gracilis]
MQQQQPGGPMFRVMPSFPPTNITTEQIQKYLDENKKLILAILDNQHLGKLAECAQYQAQLQKNLMYLAAIADAQPQTPAIPAQMSPQPATMPTQGGFYMQHPHAAAMAQQQQQPGIFPSSFNSPHHQLPPVGHNNGNTTNLGGGTSNDMLFGGSKQDRAAVGDETAN